MPRDSEVCSHYIEEVEIKIADILEAMEDSNPDKLRIAEALSFVLAAQRALKPQALE